MPLITPNTTAVLGQPSRGNSHQAEIELLKKAGIIKAGDSIESHFIDEMQRVGLSVPSVLSQLATLMQGADSDGVKLSAVKTAISLYMHPAVVSKKDALDKLAPQITFNIGVPEGAKTQVNMGGILTPRPDRTIDVVPTETVDGIQNSDSW